MEFEPVAGPRTFEGRYDFLRGKIFGVNHAVNPHRIHYIGVTGVHEVVRVDAGNGFFSPQCLGYAACDYVACFVRRDGYKQIGVTHRRVPQRGERRGIPWEGHQIIVGVKHGKPVRVVVNQQNILLLS